MGHPDITTYLYRAGQGLVLEDRDFSPTAPVSKHSLSAASVWPWAKSVTDSKIVSAMGAGSREFSPAEERDLGSEYFAVVPWKK